ncbi:cation:proton antiporter [Candidatus Bathyarchaeota archaeon]|nr:cation:proton antiporter [Candidatus Bathyarchaeota archaeon]MBS7630388.1 cation:proton antiporter [Candidatus Bathyarchaeota archaeon]
MHEESLISLFLMLSLMLLASYLLHFILDKLRMPSLLAPLLAGFFFKLIPSPFMNIALGEGFYILSQLGITFLLFLVGLQLDLRELRSLSSQIAVISVSNIIISMFLGSIVLVGFGYPLMVSFIVATALATVAETTIAPILDELGVIKTRMANLILIPGIVDDIVEVVLASLASFIVGTREASANPFTLIFGFFVFLAMVLIFQRILFPIVIRKDKNPKDSHFLLLIMFTTFFFTFISLNFRLGLLLGSLVSGIVSQQLIKTLNREAKTLTIIKAVAYGFLGPIFFFEIGLNTSFSDILTIISLFLLLLAVNFVGKFASALIAGRIDSLNLKEVILIGLGSSAKFSMGIIPVQILFSAGVIDQTVFSAFIAVSTITTMIVPFTLAYGIERWKKELAS